MAKHGDFGLMYRLINLDKNKIAMGIKILMAK